MYCCQWVISGRKVAQAGIFVPLCGRGIVLPGANFSLLMSSSRVTPVLTSPRSWPVYLPECVMHWRCFQAVTLRIEGEVGESGRALTDSLHSRSAWRQSGLLGSLLNDNSDNNWPANVRLHEWVGWGVGNNVQSHLQCTGERRITFQIIIIMYSEILTRNLTHCSSLWA